jgi:hypothetical protein
MKTIIFLLLLIATPLFAQENPAFTRWDLSLYWGPSLSQFGGIQELGKPNFNTIVEANYYFKKNHGFGASVGNEFGFDSSSKFPEDTFSVHTLELHYTWRYRPEGTPIQFSASPGAGIQTLYGTDELNGLSTGWALDYKIMADLIIGEWDYGKDMFAGLGFTQIFSFNDSYRGVDISGSRASALLRIGTSF